MRKWVGTFVFLWLFCQPTIAQTKYSILQGATSDTVTQFTVVAKNNERLSFGVTDKLRFESAPAISVKKVSAHGSEWAVHRIRVEGLRPRTPYSLKTYNELGELVDQRQFNMLDNNAELGRVALVSCMLRQFHNPFMWNRLSEPRNRPDTMLILGDSVYLDRTALLTPKKPETTAEVWEDFVKARQKLKFYFWQNLVPVISIWDDHDSGGDGVNSKFLLMAKIRTVYDTFFANDEIPGFLTHGPGLAKQFNLFGKNFLMLDGRTFRESNATSPLFGADQEEWLFNNVKPGANILLNGIQFFGKSLKKDSLEFNWPEYMKPFFERLRAVGLAQRASFAFVSGDVHFSELQKIESEILGYQTVEVTSSSVHSMTVPGLHYFRPKNSRREFATSTHNALLLEFDRQSFGFKFHVRAIGWRGQVPFKQSLFIGGPCENQLLTEGITH